MEWKALMLPMCRRRMPLFHRLKAKEAGMDEHIAKPVDPKLLVKVIYESVD